MRLQWRRSSCPFRFRRAFLCINTFGNYAQCFCILFSLFRCSNLCAQDSHTKDTVTLQNLTVTAFAANAKWKNIPASVAVLNEKELQCLGNSSLVPALNTVPGVRMEERSPGSYRLSVRGSLLRSPFGIRNIKVYWNDIPFTDAGGRNLFF